MFELREELLWGNLAGSEREKFGEVLNEEGLYLVERDVALEKFFESRGFAIGDAAGNDKVEETQVGCDVVGKAVRSDPAADVHADSRKFFFPRISHGLHPDAGFAGNAVGPNAEISGGTHQGLFECADIPVDIAADALEIENRVADDLAGAVIGDVTTTIGFAQLDTHLAKDVFGREKIFLAGVAAEGNDVGMLAEEEYVVDGAGLARGDEAFLEGVGVGPREEAEVGGEEAVHVDPELSQKLPGSKVQR